jgi:hypothetical protein
MAEAGRRPDGIDAGESALSRGRARAQMNEGDATELLVVAPLRFGHRSVLSGEIPRRRPQTCDAMAMQGLIKRGEGTGRFVSSPGAQWCGRRGEGRSMVTANGDG